MINVLFAANDRWWDNFGPSIQAAFDTIGLEALLSKSFAPDEVDYIVYSPKSDLQDFRPYTRAKAVLNLWAGVETVVDNDTLTIPFARMVEAGLSEGMRDWVTGHVMRHHLGMDAHLQNPDRLWDDERSPPLARERTICILGLGELGRVCAEALVALGFKVTGWSRSVKFIPDVACFAGDDIGKAVAGADMLVLLLPATPATENIVSTELLAKLKPGAFVLNPGRGPLIDDAALLAALNSGQIAHATLDVFRQEPLPFDHAYWEHPGVTVTPHIASTTRPSTAAQVIAEQIARVENGEPLLYLVDRNAGY